MLNVCPFVYNAVVCSGSIGPASLKAVVAITDRPKSACNSCVFELFLGYFVL